MLQIASKTRICILFVFRCWLNSGRAKRERARDLNPPLYIERVARSRHRRRRSFARQGRPPPSTRSTRTRGRRAFLVRMRVVSLAYFTAMLAPHTRGVRSSHVSPSFSLYFCIATHIGKEENDKTHTGNDQCGDHAAVDAQRRWPARVLAGVTLRARDKGQRASLARVVPTIQGERS